MSQTTSLIKLEKLAYMSDMAFVRTLLSSADFFPGLYRHTLGTLPFPHENLNHQQLIMAYTLQQHMGKHWTREDWFADQQETHQHTMEAATSRNQSRADLELAQDLERRAEERFMRPTMFSLAAIDIENPVKEIVVNNTYLMMGSHIRFEEDAVYVGYDDVTEWYAERLAVPFDRVLDYINQILLPEDISRLFLHSQVIASLDFSWRLETGVISTTEVALQGWKELSAPIFAAPVMYPFLPIRFAKPLGVTNVTRI